MIERWRFERQRTYVSTYVVADRAKPIRCGWNTYPRFYERGAGGCEPASTPGRIRIGAYLVVWRWCLTVVWGTTVPDASPRVPAKPTLATPRPGRFPSHVNVVARRGGGTVDSDDVRRDPGSVAVDDTARLRAALDQVSATVAEMHAAALGKVQGPVYGVVEDVARLRELAEKMAEAIRVTVEYVDPSDGAAKAEPYQVDALQAWHGFVHPDSGEN